MKYFTNSAELAKMLVEFEECEALMFEARKVNLEEDAGIPVDWNAVLVECEYHLDGNAVAIVRFVKEMGSSRGVEEYMIEIENNPHYPELRTPIGIEVFKVANSVVDWHSLRNHISWVAQRCPSKIKPMNMFG
jgi:hypothetical protein